MGKKVFKSPLFGYVDGKFINLYSEENPVLSEGQECYFLMTNTTDTHRPLVCFGKIIVDVHIDGLNKLYYIELKEVLEEKHIIDEFLYRKKGVLLTTYKDEVLTASQKNHYLSDRNTQEFFAENLVRSEGFFVRDSHSEIIKLQIDYIRVIKDDLINQIADINQIFLSHGKEEHI